MKRREVTKREVAAIARRAGAIRGRASGARAQRRPADHDHRALLARHRHRHPGALDRDRAVAAIRPAGRGRQPDRRQRQYRHRHGGARGARRQHAADDRQGVRGQSEPVQERAVRSGQELRRRSSSSPPARSCWRCIRRCRPTTCAGIRRVRQGAPPGTINYGSPGFATPHHLSWSCSSRRRATNLMHIPYKGTSGVMTDLIGNHVSAMFIPTHVALPFMREKQIRVLGVASRERCRRCRTCRRCTSRAWAGRERSLVRPAGAGRHAARDRRALQHRDQRDHPRPGDGRGARQAGPDRVRRRPRGAARSDRQGPRKWAKIIADAGIKAE